MKMKKILIIFLIALIITFIIYKKFNVQKRNILILGDNNISSLVKENYLYYLKNNINIDKINNIFSFDYKNYKGIIDDIKTNYYIYSKDNKIYLNKEIYSSNLIIISANNNDYISKCKKSNSILKEYNKKIFNEVNELIKLINKIGNSKILILGNYCSNYNKEISNYLDTMYKSYNYINMYKLYNKYKNDNFEYHIYEKIIELVN